MRPLDLTSLGLLTVGNLIAMATLLPLVMGQRISPAARQVQRFFLLQAAAWIALLLVSDERGSAWEPPLAIGTTALAMSGQWTLGRALGLWLGPRPGRGALLLCCLAGPVGFALLWPHGLARFIWFSTAQGLGLMLLARMCLRPGRDCARGWRWVLCGAGTAVALALWARAGWAWASGAPLSYVSPGALNHAFIVLCSLSATAMFAAALAAWRDETSQQLRTLVVTDELTGLLNRRGFEERAPAMLAHAWRHQLPVAALMLDLDHFKGINDALGHEAGDQALRLFGRLVLAQRRESDLAARLGGEEFCLLLHGDAAAARALDRRLRESLRTAAAADLGHALDYSAGMALRHPDEKDLAALLARADAALYAAKANGRGRLQEAAPNTIESIAACA
jgi:diguanylate cyclase (GGDEF)-like protein